MMNRLIRKALASILGPIAEPFARALLRNAVPWVTYNYKGGVLNGTATGPTFSHSPFSMAEVKLDFAAIAAQRVAAGQAAIDAADVLEVMGVPAGVWVPFTAIQVVTAEGGAATVQLGDGADPNGFIAAGDINTVGWLHNLVTTPYSVAVGGGRLYSAADTIDVTVDTAAVAVAVMHVFVAMVDLRKVR